MSDGSIIISTKIDQTGANVGIKKLQNKLESATQAVKKQGDVVKSLEADYQRWADTAADVRAAGGIIPPELQTGLDTASTKLTEGQTKLEQLQIKATEAGTSLKEAMTPRVPQAFTSAAKSAENQMSRFKTMLDRTILRAAVMVAVYKAIQAIQQYFSSALKVNKDYVKAAGQLKAAFMTMAQPLLSVVIPALTTMTRVLTVLITLLANFFAMLAGSSLSASQKSAKSLYNQQKALDGVGSSAKKAGEGLAKFDEIDKLGDKGSGSSTIAPDFSGLSNFETAEYKRKIDEITVYVSGALLALGAILLFSGANMPLGLGLLALGALNLAAETAENWDAADGKVRGAINKVLITIGASALVIGAVLTFSGANLPLGIGLMVTGAASLATAVALNWDDLNGKMRNAITGILELLGGALLVVGGVLAFSGANIPLGIGLMIAGAASLAAAAVLNWSTISKDIKGAVTELLIILGAALLAVGAVLTFTGANLPVGIGMMIAGGASLVAAAVINWDAIVTAIKPVIAGIVAILSGSLIVLGVLLCLSGAGIGLGLAVLAAGLAGSYAAWKIDDNPVTNFVKKMANAIISIANFFIDKLNALFHLKFDGLSIAGKVIIPSFDTQLVSISHIPALATGAVIPPNREFMAVLGDQKSGTNIETPLATMVQAFKQAMAESGGGRSMTIILELDSREFGRAVYKANNEETQRVGLKFA